MPRTPTGRRAGSGPAPAPRRPAVARPAGRAARSGTGTAPRPTDAAPGRPRRRRSAPTRAAAPAVRGPRRAGPPGCARPAERRRRRVAATGGAGERRSRPGPTPRASRANGSETGRDKKGYRRVSSIHLHQWRLAPRTIPAGREAEPERGLPMSIPHRARQGLIVLVAGAVATVIVPATAQA